MLLLLMLCFDDLVVLVLHYTDLGELLFRLCTGRIKQHLLCVT